MTVREIGRAIGSDSHKTWTMAEYLVRTGLVVKRNRRGGRKYVALNRRLPIYRGLLALLLALDKRWPAKHVDQPSYRWKMWNDDGALTPMRLDLIFFSPVRSRVLLLVTAIGTSNMSTIYDLLGIGSVSALFAVNHWEREGVITSQWVGRHRLVCLNQKYPAFRELRSLLAGLVSHSDEYRAYRRLGRARMKPILENLLDPDPRLSRRRVRPAVGPVSCR